MEAQRIFSHTRLCSQPVVQEPPLPVLGERLWHSETDMSDQLSTHRSSPPAPQPESNDLVVSINSLLLRCFKDLQGLLSALSTQDEPSSARAQVSEELGRLRVWAGNFGAHRKQTDRLSLDHRLREAPDLHRVVRNHLDDLSKTTQEGKTILKTPKL